MERRVRARRRSSSGSDKGTRPATVLIETLPAAFEMDEILYELRDHSAGLQPLGAWTTSSAPSSASPAAGVRELICA